MASKDQAIGGLIFLVCLVVIIGYIISLLFTEPLVNWLTDVGWPWELSISGVQFWLVAVPVFIAFIAILGIGAWIGWTMATTPPPKPIEEIEAEEKKEEEEEKKD